MTEEVTQQSRAVIPVLAPAKETVEVEAPLRGIPEKLRPVDVMRSAFRRNGIHPRAVSRVAIGESLNQRDLAQNPFLHDVSGHGIQGTASPLVSELKDDL